MGIPDLGFYLKPKNNFTEILHYPGLVEPATYLSRVIIGKLLVLLAQFELATRPF